MPDDRRPHTPPEQPPPEDLSPEDRPPEAPHGVHVAKDPTDARAGRVTPGGGVRWVLGVSFTLVVIGMLVVLLFFW